MAMITEFQSENCCTAFKITNILGTQAPKQADFSLAHSQELNRPAFC